jgi:hypothetical protein
VENSGQWIAALIGGAIIFFSFKDRWSGRRVFLDLGCSTNIHLSES